MLRIRVVSAIVLVPLVIGSVVLGGLAFFALVFLALLLAGYEFYQMAQRAGYRPIPAVGHALIALTLLDAYAQTGLSREILTAALVITLIVAIFQRGDGWLVGWALTFAGALYVGWFGAYFLRVRGLPDGMIWTALALLTAWAADTGAYLVGRRIGRRGFFTAISPKKTWEGAVGGEVAAILTALLLGSLWGLPALHSLAFGFCLGIAAALGDLAESLIKRQFGAKDSSNIVPGHGGALDRLDSLLFAAVFAYYYVVVVWRV